MKSTYDEARSDLREVANDLEKDVRNEAQEAYRTVKESADERKQEIKDNFKGIRNMERNLNDDRSRDNIRGARKAKREALDDLNLEVSIARDAFDNDQADFRENANRVKRDARNDEIGTTIYDKAENMIDDALRTENYIDEDMLDSLDNMDAIVEETR